MTPSKDPNLCELGRSAFPCMLHAIVFSDGIETQEGNTSNTKETSIISKKSKDDSKHLRKCKVPEFQLFDYVLPK